MIDWISIANILQRTGPFNSIPFILLILSKNGLLS
jgi:hypothetical protein